MPDLTLISKELDLIQGIKIKFKVCRARMIKHFQTAPAEVPYVGVTEVVNFMKWMNEDGRTRHSDVLEWQKLDESWSPIYACILESFSFHKQGNQGMALLLAKDTVDTFLDGFFRSLNDFEEYLYEQRN